MRSNQVGKRAAVALVAVAVGCVVLHAGSARAVDREWLDASPGFVYFQDDNRWSGGVAPGASDRAVFDLGTTPARTILFNGSATNLALLFESGTATFDLQTPSYTYTTTAVGGPSITVGSGAGNTAQLTIAGSTLLGTSAVLGTAGGTGSLLLDGPSKAKLNLSDQLVIGSNGTGSFEVGNLASAQTGSGILGQFAGSSGAAVVNSFGAWNVQGDLTVGMAGQGSLQIGNGNVNTGGGASVGGNLYIGRQAGSTGTVTLTPGLTSMAVNGSVYVGGDGAGPGGTGTLNITSPYAAFNITNGGLYVYAGSSVVIDAGAQQGQFVVDSIMNEGGSIDWRSGRLSVTGSDGFEIGPGGPLGAEVRLTPGMELETYRTAWVKDGGKLVIDGGTFTGQGLSGSFGLHVDPGGQLLYNAGTIAVHSTTFALTIEDGGILRSETPGDTGAVVSLDGATRKTIFLRGDATIGGTKSGTLNLTGLGRFVAESGLVLGESAGSNGTANINGDFFNGTTGSIESQSGLTVGKAGTGTLNVINGYTQTGYDSGGTVLGDEATGHGVVHLGDAANSRTGSMRAVGELVVGNAGVGELTVEEGSGGVSGNPHAIWGSDSVRPDADLPMYVAKLPGSTGTVTIAGNWTHYGPVFVGGTESADGGTATMTLVNGSFGAASMTIRKNGTVIVDGGGLYIGTLDNSHGGTFDFRSGSFSLGQGELLIGGGGPIGPSVTAASLSAPVVQVAPDAHLTVRDGLAGNVITIDGSVANNGSVVGDLITIGAGGRLSGNGFVAGFTGSDALVTVLGTVAPGNSVGRIDAQGNIAFGDGGVFSAELGPDGAADLLAIVGNLDLSAANDSLDLLLADGAGPGRYLIATYTGTLAGAFDHVTPGYGIEYGNGEIAVTVVPEPTGLGAVVLASAAGLGYRRRQRR